MKTEAKNIYFKFKNSYGPDSETWWLYSKIIKENGDSDTCQVFQFEITSRDDHFKAGLNKGIAGLTDTNSYQYFEDLGEPCTQEEFNRELGNFLNHFNNWVQGSILNSLSSENKNEFKTLVKDMRRWQQNYFRNRDKEALKRSKELEARVDAELHKLDNPELFS